MSTNTPNEMATEADAMAARVLRTYRDIFAGADQRDLAEAVSQRVIRTYRDAFNRFPNDDGQIGGA